jgi:drug/metabolite transporter (DMT)-like permease
LEATKSKTARKAALLLFLATVLWATTFILTKALGDVQRERDSAASSWLISALSLVIRFGLGAGLVALWQARRLRELTRLEITQGIGLALFGGVGILLQMDGVMHTDASTCAFLTQCYCVFIPAFFVWRRREFPTVVLMVACAMVLTGIGVLANVDWRQLRIGRGEMETVASSLFFTIQILWLERKVFVNNSSGRATFVMFATTTVVLLPVLIGSGGTVARCVALYSSPASIVIIIFLAVACTVTTFGIMNEWQPHVPATEAGLIYCCEPMFTSIFALFLPGWVSRWSGIAYANEHVTARMILGGGLIMSANLLVQLKPKKSFSGNS